MNIAAAVNAAVWFNVALFTNTWVPWKRKSVPHQEGLTFGDDSLSYEMVVEYIVEYWYNPTPES
jgi:hypothetical protein